MAERASGGPSRERVAIVGGGVAGLTAGYLLSRRYDVELYEASRRVGGNAYTVTTARGETVDIAVAAFGKAGYPRFYALLNHLGVRTRVSPSAYMSFRDLDTGRGLYVTPTLQGLWAQRFDLLRPSRLSAFLRVLAGVQHGRWRLRRGCLEGLTLGQALDALPALRRDDDARLVLLAALCLLSSMSAAEVLDAPASFFFHKLDVHSDIISPRAFYSVRTVEGFTRRYIEALAAPLWAAGRLHIDTPVGRIERGEGGSRGPDVALHFPGGRVERFHRVVLATGADEALKLLARPTADEARLLGPWRYKPGRVVLHRDRSSFPPRPLSQAYTFLYTRRRGVLDTSVNGDLRYEPGVDPACDLVSSQHPNFPIDPSLVELDTVLRTPVFDFAAAATVPSLGRLNAGPGVFFCGSYFGHGLHEDAVGSAMDVAAALGAPFPGDPAARGRREA